ncbi:carboxymuconolactone decarboxylase family protein [Georgenia halophila]|uniref:Carboxymuconolactone decarboxylase family protein n=1 Tax=Georgenia halophila TaxID=620889 RepID=A0ABP8LPU6_9MICO
MTSTSTETVGVLTRLDIDTTAPAFSRGLAALDAAATRELDEAGVEPGLRELVRLRASQINGCAYCVAEHTRDALSAGEPIGRLAAVAVWRESPFFTTRERAALALTDTMTRVADTHVPDADWREASAHLNPAELGALVSLIVVINAWNTVGVTTRAWTPTI